MSATIGYDQFVRARQDAILREFFSEPGHCFIGIPGLEAFRSRYYGSGLVRPLPGAGTDAFIWSRGAGTEELWVRPFDKAITRSGAYRDHWNSFVMLLGGGAVTSSLGGRAQVVDHLLPESFAARHGYAYVRVTMVDDRGNATVGSTVEKSMAGRANPGHSMLADWFTVAKASCFRGSFAAAVTPEAVMTALRTHLALRSFTLPPGEADSVTKCMEEIVVWARAG